MAKKSSSPGKKAASGKTITLAVVISIAVLVLILLPVGGFAVAASQETHDAFCGSCHTEPESTYLERSTTQPPVDLASFHATEGTRCIDCHSGAGVPGRMLAEMMGAQNALKWYSGTALQPAPLTRPIDDENCLKCHREVTDRNYVPENQVLDNSGEARNGHWHVFLQRWQAASSKAGSCVSCHTGHNTDGEAQLLYLNRQQTEAVCDSCHRVMGDD
jgi:predicted CXXCH cytochrome family protein